MVTNFLVPPGKVEGYFWEKKKKTQSKYKNLSFSSLSTTHLSTFAFQCCGITADDKLSESLRPQIYSSDPCQHCLHDRLHLAKPKSSFLLTSLLKLLSLWAASFSSGAKHRPYEQTFLPIYLQQPWQKHLPLLAKPTIIFIQTSQHTWHPFQLLSHSQKLD